MLQGWQSALDAHGSQALHLRDLTGLLTLVCGLVWVVVVAVLIGAVLRRRPGAGLVPEPDRAREARIGRVVGGGVIATAAIITGLTVASFLTTRNLADADPEALLIRVRGYQWWWEVAYLDPRPDRVLLTANEIHVPVGRPVRLQLVGADVIHSFWVPSLAGKMDMIPGRDNELSFTAERPGTYRGQCAEFCGLQHAHMAVLVVAEPPDRFAAWRRAQLGAAASREGEAGRGRAVFLSKPCAACHTVRGTPAAGTLGPDLTHVASRRTIAAGLLPTTPGALAAWVADPQTIKPGSTMPMVSLSPEELRAVTAYLASLR
ncbi:cytochrome c oxidase subunit II [Methylobacterium sp. ID0610]|uniref:cytochrome c oxidase subunit II n=1 Tax=Methylobacterium carpenticola TaxID=3344827 RepID=UPI00368A4FD7